MGVPGMEGKHRPPRLKKIGHRGKITIWLVDGAYLRTHLGKEFTGFGQHFVFSFIPKTEFWIDEGTNESDIGFIIDHLLVEHRLMLKGMPYARALERANKKEMIERKRTGDILNVIEHGNLPEAKKAHVRLWKAVKLGPSVWIVDGRLVRSVFDADFPEGGHDRVYGFIPENEVWIDTGLDDAERPFVLLHELHERNLMVKGWPYNRAHDDASRLEYNYRHHPNEVHIALAEEGWEPE
jgi:hypothetical protein